MWPVSDAPVSQKSLSDEYQTAWPSLAVILVWSLLTLFGFHLGHFTFYVWPNAVSTGVGSARRMIQLHEWLILIVQFKKIIVWKINALIAIVNVINAQP